MYFRTGEAEQAEALPIWLNWAPSSAKDPVSKGCVVVGGKGEGEG